MNRFLLLVFLMIGAVARAQVTEQREQSEYTIKVESRQPSGIINEMLYGQLFEHI